MRYIIALTFLCVLSFPLIASEKPAKLSDKLKVGAWAEYEIILPKKPRSEVLYEVSEQPKTIKEADSKKADKKIEDEKAKEKKDDKKGDKPEDFDPKLAEKIICRLKVDKVNKDSVDLSIRIGFSEKTIPINQSVGDVATIFGGKQSSRKKHKAKETTIDVTIRNKKIKAQQFTWDNSDVEKWESSEVPFELVYFSSGLFKMKLIDYGWK